MNQIVAAGAAFLLALMFLGLGRKPQNLFKTRLSKQLSLQTKSLVSSPKKSKEPKFKTESFVWQIPKTVKQKVLLRKKLRNLMSSCPEDRLLAVKTADKWGDFTVLPILRLGLRDFDSRVVIAAAHAISRFRGYPNKSKRRKKTTYPLNVSRIR